ncbi:beta-3 adrenergic receptor-like [Diadema antillarum]|uniref:beta-3 adrenergic receptor-like n=1 Tax=Diadema antillarum TaxID=105358 RepID=UPI003A83EF7A
MATNETEDSNGLFVFDDYNQRIVMAACMIAVAVTGTVGNSLVILAVALSRKLQSATNCFVVNLAFADLITCLSLPFGTVALLSKGGWPLPGWICAVTAAIGFICLGASVMTLALIAYNRWYLLTKLKSDFQRVYTKRNIILMVIMAWLYPFILVVVPHFAGLGKLGYSKEYKTCTQDTSLPTSELYSLFAGVFAIIPVFTAIVIIYIRIFRFVTQQSKKMSAVMTATPACSSRPVHVTIETSSSSGTPLTEGTSTGDSSRECKSHSDQAEADTDIQHHQVTTCSTTEGASNESKTSVNDISGTGRTTSQRIPESKGGKTNTKQQRSVTKSPRQLNRYHVTVTKRLSVVVLAFFVCLLPFGISVCIPPSDPGIPWTGLLLTVNSCVNPLIYARTMPMFRDVMACLLRCRFRQIPEPVGFIRRRI